MPIETLDPANSILFVGSGFSAGASNIANEKVPAGRPLLKKLAGLLEEDPNDLDLKSAADEFLSRSDLSLYELVYETFTISELLPYQHDILALPWARIYTTNYDDIISQVKGTSFPLYTFDEPRPRRLPSAFAVHLHGSIRRAREDNVDEQLVLNNKSYDVIAREHPSWFYEFQRDRRTFEACYFLGFSLGDHHISGLMTAGEESVKRTYFVSQKDPSATFVRRASEYGEVAPIGFEAFANLAKSLPKPERPKDLNALQSFKYLRPGLDGKQLAKPTPVEIINLVSFGTFNQSRFFNTPADEGYVAPRNKAVDDTIDALKTNKTALIHSRLGNGKTIFTSLLSVKATNAGFVCLLWRRAGRNLAQDLEAISEYKKVLVIFDDYDSAIDNIEQVLAGLPHAKFVVTVRTGQQEVRFHEIIDKFPEPVKRINLNTFSNEDRDQLLAILHRAGAQASDLQTTVRSARDIRDIVTQLYNHSEIRTKLHSVIENAPPALVQIIVLASLIKWAGVETDDSYLQELTGRDVYAELRKNEAFAHDILDAHDDKVEMRSALLSEYFIQRILPTKSVLDGCYEITTSSLRRKSDRAHRRLSAELVKFSTLRRFLRHHADSDEALNRHYVRLSNDKDVNAAPLFWLQYAILMKTSGDLAKARMFLDSGYERAAQIDGFKTFQLDTQALSIYLLEEIGSNDPLVEGLERILTSIRLVANMINDQSHRYHAIEVIGEVPAFIDARRDALQNSEKVALVIELNRAAQALATLPLEDQIHTGSEIVRGHLEAAVASLVS